jgi:glycosyltransferase involved in cell wall biosynthesis
MISIIIPTLGTREEELIRLLRSIDEQTIRYYEVILVSQDHHEVVEGIVRNFEFPIKHIKTDKKGLSSSRNIGMGYVTGKILTFSDDDCWYEPSAFEEIVTHFNHTNGDIACFQIYDPGLKEYYKDYPDQAKKRLTLRDLFRKSSIEIFINLEKVDRTHIKFDEQFGLGAKYPSGEENIFLHHMYKNGYAISYTPKVVVYHKKPTVDSRLNLTTFRGKGPLFKRMFNTPLGLIMVTLLFIKKFPKLEKPFQFYVSAVKELFAFKKID